MKENNITNGNVRTMTKTIAPKRLRRTKLLGAALQLRRSHGILYAMRFLEEHGFDERVIWELLGLIPVEQCQSGNATATTP